MTAQLVPDTWYGTVCAPVLTKQSSRTQKSRFCVISSRWLTNFSKTARDFKNTALCWTQLQWISICAKLPRKNSTRRWGVTESRWKAHQLSTIVSGKNHYIAFGYLYANWRSVWEWDKLKIAGIRHWPRRILSTWSAQLRELLAPWNPCTEDQHWNDLFTQYISDVDPHYK